MPAKYVKRWPQLLHVFIFLYAIFAPPNILMLFANIKWPEWANSFAHSKMSYKSIQWQNIFIDEDGNFSGHLRQCPLKERRNLIMAKKI